MFSSPLLGLAEAPKMSLLRIRRQNTPQRADKLRIFKNLFSRLEICYQLLPLFGAVLGFEHPIFQISSEGIHVDRQHIRVQARWGLIEIPLCR